MLWTDRDFITGADLITLDREVQDVASAEGIALDDPATGIIHRALEEAGDSIMKQQQAFGGYLSSQTVSSNHNNAVMNIGLPSVNHPRVLLNQVVVSGVIANQWTALKRWAAYWALVVFFRDASNRTLNDRYKDKAAGYKKELHTTYWDAVRSVGLPIVRQPFPCPGAVYEPLSGVWGDDNVPLVAGAGTATVAYDVAISWVDNTAYVSPALPGQAESACSDVVTMTPTPGNVLSVNIASLTPPTGAQHPSTVPMALVAYCKASGWNVYAGLTGGPLYLQNASPIPVGTHTFTFPGDPLVTGHVATTGQFADFFFTFQNVLQRA